MSDAGMTNESVTPPPAPPQESALEVTRRRFLSLLFWAATAVGLGALAAPLIRFAYPVLRAPVFERVRIASADDVPREGIRFEYQEIPSMLIQKEDRSFAALSLVCTHLGCIVKWFPELGQFRCPCHAGHFTDDGIVISGPPPRPLPKFQLAIEGNDIFVEGIERA